MRYQAEPGNEINPESPRSQAPPGNALSERLRLADLVVQAEPAKQCITRREPGNEINPESPRSQAPPGNALPERLRLAYFDGGATNGLSVAGCHCLGTFRLGSSLSGAEAMK